MIWNGSFVTMNGLNKKYNKKTIHLNPWMKNLWKMKTKKNISFASDTAINLLFPWFRKHPETKGVGNSCRYSELGVAQITLTIHFHDETEKTLAFHYIWIFPDFWKYLWSWQFDSAMHGLTFQRSIEQQSILTQ